MRRFLPYLFFLLLFAGSAFAALKFPALTGRVVDDAGMLSSSVKQQLEQKLEDYEGQSTNQVVVVTLPSLQGTEIEDFGYQLGRKWGIGQKGKDNGVLLIVAPKERKVRIEVGYGLEGTLTDALSSEIIQSVILPHFRSGEMQEGVVAGADAIISVLKGGSPFAGNADTAGYNYSDSGTEAKKDSTGDMIAAWLILLLILFEFYLACSRSGSYGGSFLGGGSFGGGGGFGGGFSGGGGSFGGGGASGGW